MLTFLENVQGRIECYVSHVHSILFMEYVWISPQTHVSQNRVWDTLHLPEASAPSHMQPLVIHNSLHKWGGELDVGEPITWSKGNCLLWLFSRREEQNLCQVSLPWSGNEQFSVGSRKALKKLSERYVHWMLRQWGTKSGTGNCEHNVTSTCWPAWK